MKQQSQRLFIKSLKYAIDLALVLQSLLVIVCAVTVVRLYIEDTSELFNISGSTLGTVSSGLNNIMIAFSNPIPGENIGSIMLKIHLFFGLCGFINIITLILITLQMKYIFDSFILEDYFYPSNSLRIRKIALTIFIWVIADYLIRFIPGLIVPQNFVSSSVGLNSFGSSYGLFGFDLKMVIISVIIYTLSFVFKYGNVLKEESSLTI